jgi:uncharacterized protein (DUF111 family)
MYLHLIASGAVTGDMFIAAVLDAFPRLEGRVLAAVDAADSPYPVACSLVPHADYEAAGQQFKIEPFDKYFGRIPFAFAEEGPSWEALRRRLKDAPLQSGIRAHAHNIFESIVKIESKNQRVSPERVVFEETAAWNSMAQVVGAAALIEALQPARWSASPSQGEAADVTGAAIVNYLCPANAQNQPIPRTRLACSGAGYGVSSNNVLRLLCFEAGDPASLRVDDMNRQKAAAGGAQQQRNQ